jgi:hypothetical protein
MEPAIAALFKLCSTRQAAACLSDRLRSAVRTHQSVCELAMSTASAPSDHYPAHAQLFEPHTHPIPKTLRNVIDGDGSAELKRVENNFINRYVGPPSFAGPYALPQLLTLFSIEAPELAKDRFDGICGRFDHRSAAILCRRGSQRVAVMTRAARPCAGRRE